MQNEVRDAIARYHMLERADRVIVAVSGGADSTALLHTLVQLNPILQVTLRVIHVHHGLRGQEADQDAQFVEAICRRYRLNCKVVEVKADEFAKAHHMSVEEAGRLLRYQIFEKEALLWEEQDDTQKKVKVAVAHNLEDNAETILMQLARGSGLKGVAGMKPVRGRIIRPMLFVSRNEVERYLTKEEMKWRTDSTNLHDDYTRNRVRHGIMPMLIKDVNSNAVENITRAGLLIGSADIYIMRQAQKLFDTFTIRPVSERVGLPIDMLKKQDPIIRTYLLRLLISSVNRSMKNITARHIEDMESLMFLQSGKMIMLPYGLEAMREYNTLWVGRKKNVSADVQATDIIQKNGTKKKKLRESSQQENIEDPSSSKKYADEARHWSFRVINLSSQKDKSAPKDIYRKWFDYDKIEDIMETRTRRSGDTIEIRSGEKTVKAYMTDEKIPVSERENVPILAVNQHVMWIVGYRISERYKIGPKTSRVLEVIYRN